MQSNNEYESVLYQYIMFDETKSSVITIIIFTSIIIIFSGCFFSVSLTGDPSPIHPLNTVSLGIKVKPSVLLIRHICTP